MTVRAQRLLSSVEKGATTGAAMQTALANDPSLKGELMELLTSTAPAKRVVLIAAVNVAFSASNHAIDCMFSSDAVKGQIGVARGSRPLAAIGASDAMSAKYIASYASGIDALDVGSSADLFGSAANTADALGTANGRAAFTNMNPPLTTVSGNAAYANNVFQTSLQPYTGLFLDYMRSAIDGLAPSVGLQGVSLATLAASAAYSATLAASATAMNCIANSSVLRTQLSTGSAWFNGLTGSTHGPAIARYFAGMAGLDPTAYTTLTAMAGSNTILTAIQNDANATAFIASVANASCLDELFAVANFRTFLNAGGALNTAVLGNSQAVAKWLAYNAGIATAGITGLASLTQANWTTIGGAVAAKQILRNSDTALNYVGNGLATAWAPLDGLVAAGAAGGYFVKTFTDNTNVAVSLGVTAGAQYIALGVSRASGQTGNTYTLTTLRAGSTISNVATLDSNSDTLASDFNIAIPLTGQVSARLNAGASGTFAGYVALLRCDSNSAT